MALWHCTVCTTAYAVGLPSCPHCWSTSKTEDDTMPKITKAGGASREPAPEAAPVAEPEPVEAVEPTPEPVEKPAPRRRAARKATTDG